MPRIDRLAIQGFRSFGPNEQTLDLDAPLAVVRGPNSEGKTSLAEAVEFLFTGDIARRALLASAADEFENALRNAHLPAGTETYVEAFVTGSDGKPHTLRRTLLEDFTKRKACTSKLDLDGSEVDPAALADIGIELSEPPLAAPVLMQHTLGYLFSANPKERSSYFKSVLEVTDLEDVRDTLRAIEDDIPAPLQTHRNRVNACKAALPSVSEALAPLSFANPTVAEIRSAISTAAAKLLSDAGETPSAALTEQLSQLEGMSTDKQAKTFPLHGFQQLSQTVEWTAPEDSAWSAIDDYKLKCADVELQTRRMAALFQHLLEMPAVTASTGDIDCPVCETPESLTQERIQAIRDQVEDTENFRKVEIKAKATLGSLSASASSLEIAALAACPVFLSWDRARRISEGFRTSRIAPLLDKTLRGLLPPWLKATACLMCARRNVLEITAKATAALADAQADVTKLADDSALQAAFEQLGASHKRFRASLEAYRVAIAPLVTPLQEAVAKKSDTTGWDDLVSLGRSVAELRAELQEATAHASLATELERACRQVEAAKESVLEDKFDELAGEVRSWWELLRPGEAAFFSDLGLRRKAQRTIDFEAGLAPSADRRNPKLRNAVAVFSQSQMHCLGLATFFARTGGGGGFLVLDDPIISIDDDYSVHFIAGVLKELERRGVQVIMLTFNQKTWTEIQSRYDGGRSEAFQLHLNSPTEGTIILKSSDTLAAMLKACEPFTTSSILEHRKDGCQRIRDTAERFCKGLLVQERKKQGDGAAMISDYTDSGGTLGALIPLVTPYLDSDEPGKLRSIRVNTNPGNHDDDVPPRESLKVYLGDLKALNQKYLG